MALKQNVEKIDGAMQKYRCTQCFTTHYVNDVLFATDRFVRLCDMRQATHRAVFEPNDDFEQWCKTGKSQVMSTWRTRPKKDLQVENGVVQAMREPDGDWMKQKVCPNCHCLLSQDFLLLFGWQDGKMDNDLVKKIMLLAGADPTGKWNSPTEDATRPLHYTRCERRDGMVGIGVPENLQDAEGAYGSACRDHCCQSADGAIVQLRFALTENGELDEQEAEKTLDALLRKCHYSGEALPMPVTFLLDCPEAEHASVEFFQEKEKALLRRIKYSFEKKYLEAGAQLTPEKAGKILDWFAQQNLSRF